MKYQMCTRCLMDTTAAGIEFDEKGVCNYCKNFEERLKNPIKRLNLNLDQLVSKIKNEGKNKPYDCIVGVSGGVDSSYTLIKVKELGLRPLAVHMDNGWNSELATNNIKNLVDGLGVDLFTHVIDWVEYRELMQAFFDADVLDVELLYDNAMLAVNYQQANKFGIKYILAGTNMSTEGMGIPSNWNWLKVDKKNILRLAKKRNIKIKTFPIIGIFGFIYNEFIKNVRWVSFLDYLTEYNKFTALDILQTKFQYKPYPFKHYESIFTRFYQGYILPNKFNVDKRKVHLSSLIISNQMTREEALEQLNGIAYPSQADLDEDIQYFIKKMKWTLDDLNKYISRPEVSHLNYGSYTKLYYLMLKIYKLLFKGSM